MTVQEFSNQFDVLVSSYRRLKNFDSKEELDSLEFNEYEKSYYLTQAQEELVLSLYNGKNPSLQSFEETEELRRYLSNLIEEARLEPIITSDGKPLGIESNSKFFTLPEDLWFITYEAVYTTDSSCGEEGTMEVVPARQDEYHRLRKNPFRGANNRRALRFDLSEGNVEIVCKYNVTDYYVRYLKRLKPIILADMPNGITIKGIGLMTQCELHNGLHNKILEYAVENAVRHKLIGLGSNTSGKKE